MPSYRPIRANSLANSSQFPGQLPAAIGTVPEQLRTVPEHTGTPKTVPQTVSCTKLLFHKVFLHKSSERNNSGTRRNSSGTVPQVVPLIKLLLDKLLCQKRNKKRPGTKKWFLAWNNSGTVPELFRSLRRTVSCFLPKSCDRNSTNVHRNTVPQLFRSVNCYYIRRYDKNGTKNASARKKTPHTPRACRRP